MIPLQPPTQEELDEWAEEARKIAYARYGYGRKNPPDLNKAPASDREVRILRLLAHIDTLYDETGAA